MVEGARATRGTPERRATVRVVPYGAPAVDALHRTIAAVKAGDPLAPVTVVVPAALVAITVRRRLAAEHGAIALDTVALPGLAARLAGQRLGSDGRRPLSALQAAALARAVLLRESVRLAPAADHPGTIDALLRTFGELRPL